MVGSTKNRENERTSLFGERCATAPYQKHEHRGNILLPCFPKRINETKGSSYNTCDRLWTQERKYYALLLHSTSSEVSKI